MVPSKNLGVFCLEGPWSSALTDDSSVRLLLEVLDRKDYDPTIETEEYR